MDKNAKIYIAGHRGMVGSAIKRALKNSGYANLICKTKEELDLLDQSSVVEFFKNERPEYVFLAAAKVGGILANNTYPADFIYQNLQIQNNIIYNAHKYKVKKLLFLGSSCIYPKLANQPIKEEYLLTGLLEPTNEAYAIAKIAGLKMCQYYKKQYGANFISCMPTNLYGPNDNFDLENSHVLPALIRKFYEARKENKENITIWGSGTPKREFLFVDDLADACIFLINNYDGVDTINVGVGKDISISELAQMIKNIIGFSGEIIYDETKPDGTLKKLLDVSRINDLGWKAQTTLEDGLKKTIECYKKSL